MHLHFYVHVCILICVLMHMYALVCGSQTITLSVILRMLSAYAETQCLIGVELTN